MKRATRSASAAAAIASSAAPSKKAKTEKIAVKALGSGAVKAQAEARANTGAGDVAADTRYFLMKSEPESRLSASGVDLKFSIDDLAQEPDATAHWDGVRNYQARNIMRDEMKLGDKAFFYHSNCKEPSIVGIVTVVRESYPDHTAFDAKDPHYDPKSDPKEPRWFMVDVKLERKLKREITRTELKRHAAGSDGPLSRMGLFAQQRLSVSRVSPAEWDFILGLED